MIFLSKGVKILTKKDLKKITFLETQEAASHRALNFTEISKETICVKKEQKSSFSDTYMYSVFEKILFYFF